jgi:hypothetical protein
VTIPANTFFTVTPATNFKSKATGTLNGTDYFFYIADNNDLNVKTFSGIQSYTLAVDALWVDTIQGSDRIHVYYSLRTGQIFYQAFMHFGAGDLTPIATAIGSAAVSFSVNFAPNCVPPAYLLLLNDGVNHNLYSSANPAFSPILAQARIFSNLVDNAHYVTRPSLSIHAQDTNVVTIDVQQIRVNDGHSKVGFYVVRIPGVV